MVQTRSGRGDYRRISMSVPQMRRRACTVSLWPSETAVLSHLLAASPERFVPIEELIVAMWPDPDNEPSDAEGDVNVILSYLRTRLGLKIENEFNFGWRIPRRWRGA